MSDCGLGVKEAAGMGKTKADTQRKHHRRATMTRSGVAAWTAEMEEEPQARRAMAVVAAVMEVGRAGVEGEGDSTLAWPMMPTLIRYKA